tara:strand:- start:319 stop:477 length:159 start_codon:yes stop_codon:yes gene_type:complete
MIRLPEPSNNFPDWARKLIASLEIQQKTNELTSSTATQDAENQVEAKSWFNG